MTVICNKKEFFEENSQMVGKTCCPCKTDLGENSLRTAILAKQINAEHISSIHHKHTLAVLMSVETQRDFVLRAQG